MANIYTLDTTDCICQSIHWKQVPYKNCFRTTDFATYMARLEKAVAGKEVESADQVSTETDDSLPNRKRTNR